MLPETVAARLESSRWTRPEIFGWLQKMGNIEETEMHRTFNCGIGMTMVVPKAEAKAALDSLASHGVEAFEIGAIVPRQPGSPQTVVD